MKSLFQTLSFLSNYTPKSGLDAEFIESFLVQRFQITPTTLRNAPNFDEKPLDVHSFIRWFESGSEVLKIARNENRLVLLGNCTLETCQIIGALLPNGTIDTAPVIVQANQISEATPQEVQSFQSALLENNLQPDPEKLQLIPKFIPKREDRVIFYDFAQNIQGVGVVREINADGDVIFYCYFTYHTHAHPKRIGYSLYENPGYNLKSFVFESINKENIQTTLGNSTSCYRRLGKELGKVGKVWKDKLLRIEPIKIELRNSKYYYISDKMEVITATEEGKPTSRLRYISGNYFSSHMAASKMLDKFNALLRNYLASDKWPDIED